MKLHNYFIWVGLIALGYFAGQLSPGLSVPVQSVQAATSNVSEEAVLTPAYLIVTGTDYDQEALVPYVKALAPLYKKFGGSYVAVSRDYVVLEGEHEYDSVLIAKWPSLEMAEKFWWSPEYAEVRKLREGNGTFNAIAFEGFAQERKIAPLAERK